MSEKGVVKRYDSGEVTVVWKPDVCIHSAICFHGLPRVLDPRRRPWVDVKGAGTAEIVDQVGKCPSGALSLLEVEKAADPVVSADVEPER